MSKFNKIRPLVQLLVLFNSLIPKRINIFLLTLSRNIPFYFGILFRYVLLRNICLKVGDNVIVFEGVIFDAPEQMEIGNNVSINQNCYLAGEITLKDNISIAHTTAFHSYNHTWDDINLPIRNNPLYTKRIIVESDVWVGCNCVILSGVVISSRVVIAAGAIVNKSVESNSVAGGNPVRIIKKI